MRRRNRTLKDESAILDVQRKPLPAEEAFDKYISHQVLKNDRLITIKSTRSVFNNFKRFIESEFPYLLDDIGLAEPEHMKLYIQWCITILGNQGSTINQKVKNLKHMFNHMVKLELISRNPVESIPQRAVDKKPKSTVTKEILDKAIKTLDKNSFKDIRTMTVATLMFNTGMRVGEAASLRMKDINLKEKEIKLDKSKNRNFRVIPMNSESERIIRIWFKIRGELDTEYVFVNEYDKPITKNAIQKHIKEMFVTAGEGTMSCHSLRRGFITSLVNAGVPLPTIAAIVGHSSLDEIMTYTKITENEMHKAVKRV